MIKGIENLECPEGAEPQTRIISVDFENGTKLMPTEVTLSYPPGGTIEACISAVATCNDSDLCRYDSGNGVYVEEVFVGGQITGWVDNMRSNNGGCIDFMEKENTPLFRLHNCWIDKMDFEKVWDLYPGGKRKLQSVRLKFRFVSRPIDNKQTISFM